MRSLSIIHEILIVTPINMHTMNEHKIRKVSSCFLLTQAKSIIDNIFIDSHWSKHTAFSLQSV